MIPLVHFMLLWAISFPDSVFSLFRHVFLPSFFFFFSLSLYIFTSLLDLWLDPHPGKGSFLSCGAWWSLCFSWSIILSHVPLDALINCFFFLLVTFSLLVVVVVLVFLFLFVSILLLFFMNFVRWQKLAYDGQAVCYFPLNHQAVVLVLSCICVKNRASNFG